MRFIIEIQDDLQDRSSEQLASLIEEALESGLELNLTVSPADEPERGTYGGIQ